MKDSAQRPKSLFVVVSYANGAPCFSDILRLQIPSLYPRHKETIQVTFKDYVRSFSKSEGSPSSIWFFSPPTISTEYNMYMVQDHHCPPRPIHKPLRGIKFNFSTGECLQMKPPRASKYEGHVVNWKRHLFFMARPDRYYDTPDPVFECYDPDENKWKALQPFPHHDIYLKRCCILATAVLDETILYNLSSSEMWAYNVSQDKWYIVHVEDDVCYNIRGEAVVLENFIYALTGCIYSGFVLALSIEIEKDINGDLVYKCSMQSEIHLPFLERATFRKADAHTNSRHLVHLGGDNFCVVQSCTFYGSLDRYQQPIQLTNIVRTVEKSMIVTDIICYEVEVLREQQFQVRLCFSLPECKTTALEEGRGRFIIPLEPLEPLLLTCGDGTAAPGIRNTEGHPIYARNLPSDATFNQIEEEFKKFGTIKRDGIKVMEDKKGNSCFATLEYETATSKQRAVEASPIVIGESQVELR